VLRALAVLLHLGFAALFALAALILLAQARLNASWEIGFYHHLSPATEASMFGTLAEVSLALFQAVAAVGFAFRRGAGALGMLIVSALYMLALPFPLSGFMALTGAMALWDLIPASWWQPPEEDVE
jgi:hypothetical protein